jgi:hypothetical protein
MVQAAPSELNIELDSAAETVDKTEMIDNIDNIKTPKLQYSS